MQEKMKVAIAHDWLTGMRGGEKCLEVFCELFPDAVIFIHDWPRDLKPFYIMPKTPEKNEKLSKIEIEELKKLLKQKEEKNE